MSDAIKRRRLAHNPASHVTLPTVERTARGGWGVAEGVAFLAYVADQGDRDGELWELLIGTGIRKGEALALWWRDVDIGGRVLHVRRTLSSVDNSRLIFTAPKTKVGAAGVGLSRHVIEALRRQRTRQDAEWGEAYTEGDLVFPRENGLPLQPEYVLRRFRVLAKAAGLPRVRAHDLRHLAASFTAGVPLPIVSKTLRHSATRITADLCAHLMRETAHQAVDAMAAVLDAAEAEARATRVAQITLAGPAPAAGVVPVVACDHTGIGRDATTLRPHRRFDRRPTTRRPASTSYRVIQVIKAVPLVKALDGW